MDLSKYAGKQLRLSVSADGNGATYDFVAYSGDYLSMGDVSFRVDVASMKMDRYSKNPVLLYMHDMTSPIGTTSTEIKDGKILSSLVFDLTDNLSRNCKDRVDKGSLRALSIGFDLSSDVADIIEDGDGKYTLKNCELLEISLCTVPRDPNALKLSFAAGSDLTIPVVDHIASIKAISAGSEAEVTAAKEEATKALKDMALAHEEAKALALKDFDKIKAALENELTTAKGTITTLTAELETERTNVKKLSKGVKFTPSSVIGSTGFDSFESALTETRKSQSDYSLALKQTIAEYPDLYKAYLAKYNRK